MLPALRQRLSRTFAGFGEWVGALIDFSGAAFSVSGAVLATVFGRLAFAAVLGAIALGFFLRLSGRRRQPAAVSPKPLPLWAPFAVGLISLIEVSALVEATNLPVRFDQAGFSYLHWLLVLLALCAAYLIQTSFLRAWLSGRARNPAVRP